MTSTSASLSSAEKRAFQVKPIAGAWYWLFVTAPFPAWPTIKLLVYLQVWLDAEERIAAAGFAVLKWCLLFWSHSSYFWACKTQLSAEVGPAHLSSFVNFLDSSFLQFLWPSSLCCHQCLKVQVMLFLSAVAVCCSLHPFWHTNRSIYIILKWSFLSRVWNRSHCVICSIIGLSFYQIIWLMYQILPKLHRNSSWVLLKKTYISPPTAAAIGSTHCAMFPWSEQLFSLMEPCS